MLDAAKIIAFVKRADNKSMRKLKRLMKRKMSKEEYEKFEQEEKQS